MTQSTKVSFLKCFLTLKKKLKSQAKHRKAKKKAKKSTIADSYLDPDTDDIGAPQGSFVTPAQKSQGQSQGIADSILICQKRKLISIRHFFIYLLYKDMQNMDYFSKKN